MKLLFYMYFKCISYLLIDLFFILNPCNTYGFKDNKYRCRCRFILIMRTRAHSPDRSGSGGWNYLRLTVSGDFFFFQPTSDAHPVLRIL